MIADYFLFYYILSFISIIFLPDILLSNILLLQSLVSPFWSHAIQIWLLTELPEWLVTMVTLRMHMGIRSAGECVCATHYLAVLQCCRYLCLYLRSLALLHRISFFSPLSLHPTLFLRTFPSVNPSYSFLPPSSSLHSSLFFPSSFPPFLIPLPSLLSPPSISPLPSPGMRKEAKQGEAGAATATATATSAAPTLKKRE